MQYGKQFRQLTVVLGVGFLTLALSASVLAGQKSTQQQGQQPKQGGTPAKDGQAGAASDAKAPTWRLQVSEGTPSFITLRAKNAPLAEIATELGRKVKASVFLSPLMEKQRITLELNGMNLETTLKMLAPQSYIDYEARGDSYTPKPLALYLYGLNEMPPATTTVVQNNSQSMLVEGDTEEGTEEYEKRQAKEENPLRITYERRMLSVRAKKQPLSVVLYKIASELGIPFEMRAESQEVVDVNFSNYSLDQAIHTLSPSVRFYYRADLQTSEIQPLRLTLVAQPRS